jgi:hypothetical protein
MSSHHRLFRPMPCFLPVTARLLPHSATPCAVVDAIDVDVEPTTTGGARFEYRFRGRPELIRWPAPAAAGRCDGLWSRTCCEAFAGVGGDAAYREFNFSPSGQWAAYAFLGERKRATDPVIDPPEIDFVLEDGGARLIATLPAGALPWPMTLSPTPPASGRVELGLSVVVEDAGGNLSYWALCHPAPAPDFHQRAAFALEIETTP